MCIAPSPTLLKYMSSILLFVKVNYMFTCFLTSPLQTAVHKQPSSHAYSRSKQTIDLPGIMEHNRCLLHMTINNMGKERNDPKFGKITSLQYLHMFPLYIPLLTNLLKVLFTFLLVVSLVVLPIGFRSYYLWLNLPTCG